MIDLFLLEWPRAVHFLLLSAYLAVAIAAVRARLKPLPEMWTFYPSRVRSPAAARMLSDRLTPIRSGMSPRARKAQKMADASSLGSLKARPTLLPLPGLADDLDTEVDEVDNP